MGKRERYFVTADKAPAEASAHETHIDESADQPSTSQPPASVETPQRSARFKEEPDDLETRLAERKAERKRLRAARVIESGVKTKFYQEALLKQRETALEQQKQTKRAAAVLETESPGFIELESGDRPYPTQKEILDSSAVAIAAKRFDLTLPQFGPYRLAYTRNGRHLALAGRLGHVATVEVPTKHLHVEMNCMETTRDVAWLHNELMFAVAQKRWTYIYDKQGVELHSVRQMHQVQRLTFLPYHYLLVGAAENSFLTYLDVSLGKIVAAFPTREGPLRAMCQNPANAVIHAGHCKGTVTLWSPNVREPLVKVLCHTAPVKAIAVDSTGKYMSTLGQDRRLRIWDLRTYRPLQSYGMPQPGSALAYSQTGLLAVSSLTGVQVFREPHLPQSSLYLGHDVREAVSDLAFCPFDDVLGIAHAKGFASVLVPGAGSASLDAYEVNPYESKRQRREAEVKSLLDKIDPSMISMEANLLATVDQASLERKRADAGKIHYVNQKEVRLKRKKAKGAGVKKYLVAKSKKREEEMKAMLQEQEGQVEEKREVKPKRDLRPVTEGGSVLNRFNRKLK